MSDSEPDVVRVRIMRLGKAHRRRVNEERLFGADIAEVIVARRRMVRRVADTPECKRLARLIAYYGVRNSEELENLHASPDSRMSDPEMRVLMLSVEHELGEYLSWLLLNGVIRTGRGEFSPLELGDWHGILDRGPSYDLDEPPPWLEKPDMAIVSE